MFVKSYEFGVQTSVSLVFIEVFVIMVRELVEVQVVPFLQSSVGQFACREFDIPNNITIKQSMSLGDYGYALYFAIKDRRQKVKTMSLEGLDYYLNTEMGLWEKSYTSSRTIVREFCTSGLLTKLSGYAMGDQKQKPYRKALLHLGQIFTQNSIMHQLQTLVYDENFKKKLNSNDNLIPFGPFGGPFRIYNSITNSFEDLKGSHFFSKHFLGTFKDNIDDSNIENYGKLGEFLKQCWPHLSAESQKLKIRELQKKLGYQALGGTEAEIFDVRYGESGAGKSVLVDLQIECFNDFGGRAAHKIFQGNGKDNTKSVRFALFEIYDKRWAVLEEPQEGVDLRASLIKALTGGSDTASVEPKGGKAFDVEWKTKLTMVTNEVHSWNEGVPGFSRRIVVEHYPSYARYADSEEYNAEDPLCHLRDDKLKEKLKKEGNFLTFVINGVFRFKQANGLTPFHESTLAMTNTWKSMTSPLSTFLTDHTEMISHRNERVLSKEQLVEYLNQGECNMTSTVIGKIMKNPGRKWGYKTKRVGQKKVQNKTLPRMSTWIKNKKFLALTESSYVTFNE